MTKFSETGVMIRQQLTIALGTLAGGSGLLAGPVAVTEDFRVLKLEVDAIIEGITTGEELPFHLFLVDGGLTLAQCEEAIEQTGPLDRNDRPALERASRPVWMLGTFTQHGNLLNAFLNSTGHAEWKKRWTFSNPDGWDYMIYNPEATAPTTGANLKLLATAFGVWV